MTRALWAILAVLLLTALAWADGGIYPRQAVVKPVRTPDQRALVRWDAATGTETLVIETTLDGEGTEFAWVLPLPAAPRIEASTTGLFPTLTFMCAPRVWTESDVGWFVLLVPLWAVGLYVAARRGGVGAWFALFLFGGIVVGLVALTVPTMQEKQHGPQSSVRVLARETVGAFDTATLAAKDAADLRRWLDTNGFGAPAAIDPVVSKYIQEGWVFVASKVRADAVTATAPPSTGDGVRRVHPLAFTFPAKSAVYPMRLTGATNEELALELFVFGDRRAEAEGLRVEWCNGVGAGLDRNLNPDCHAEILRRAEGAQILTKLTGTLAADAMHRDVALRWTDAASVRPTYRTASVALAHAAGAACGVFFGALVIATLLRDVRRMRGHEWTTDVFRRDVTIAAAAAVVALGVTWLVVPTLPAGAHPLERDAFRSWPFRHDARPTAPLVGVADARAWAAQTAAGHLNPFTDEPIREEDSPGNYLIREREGRVELVMYDSYVRGHIHEITTDLSAPRR